MKVKALLLLAVTLALPMVAIAQVVVIASGNSTFQNSFTSAANGAMFEINVERPGSEEQMGWPKADADVAFLVLPDASGHVRDLKHGMFGNVTVQPNNLGDPRLGGHGIRPPYNDGPYLSNGFEALRYYDLPENGGNGNGQFDPGDRVWPLVRVWFNRAHDGYYDERRKPDEIKTLDELGILSIDVTGYVKGTAVDQYGNKQTWVSTIQTSDSGKPMQVYEVKLVVKSLPSNPR